MAYLEYGRFESREDCREADHEREEDHRAPIAVGRGELHVWVGSDLADSGWRSGWWRQAAHVEQPAVPLLHRDNARADHARANQRYERAPRIHPDMPTGVAFDHHRTTAAHTRGGRGVEGNFDVAWVATGHALGERYGTFRSAEQLQETSDEHNQLKRTHAEQQPWARPQP